MYLNNNDLFSLLYSHCSRCLLVAGCWLLYQYIWPIYPIWVTKHTLDMCPTH